MDERLSSSASERTNTHTNLTGLSGRSDASHQAVKGKCSVPFPLYGRKVHGATINQASPLGGLSAQPLPRKSDWRHAGELPRVEGFCERPQLMVNVWTGEHFTARCGSARPSKCEPCALVKKADIAAVARSGWIDKPSDRGYWVALTAPGASVLPWDRSQCSHSAGVACSGDIGCVAEEMALAAWHEGLGQAWTHFVTDLRRLLNPGLSGPPSSWPIQVEFFKTYEPQKRQALHIHSMMRLRGVCSDERFQRAYAEAARRNGFGKQLHCEQIDLADSSNGARKGGYCAKYSTKCADMLPEVKRLDVSTGELRQGGFRSWSSSRHWGENMRTVQERRRTWASGGGRPAPAAAPAAAGGAAALDSYQGIYAGQGAGQSVNPSDLISDAG